MSDSDKVLVGQGWLNARQQWKPGRIKVDYILGKKKSRQVKVDWMLDNGIMVD